MLIVFGTAHKGKRVRPLLDTYCFPCKRDVTWEWYRLTEWLTAYFIRVLPVKNEYFLVCGACGDRMSLTKDEATGIQKLSALTPDESISLHDSLVARLETHQLQDRTETQREYLKSQRQRR
ncbi:MAG TPA: hypothetical protein VK629_07290 [Steroidobacteraceae bacterium]|nr:hypothetical protein [Steroidobacteraceae bacterium]